MTLRTTLVLAALLVPLLAMGPSRAQVLPASCVAQEDTLADACVFLCRAGERVHVSAWVTLSSNRGSAVQASAACGGALALCHDVQGSFRFASCEATSATVAGADGVGTCEASGLFAVRVACGSA